jgi:Tfp pilus assembly protein PilV
MSVANRRFAASSRIHGFTLVEVLAALLFLGILIPAIMTALTSSNRAAVVSERSVIAAELGENKLNEIIAEESWTSAGSRGDFGTDWPGYRWELKQTAWNSADVTELTITVFYSVQANEQQVQFSTLAAQSETTQ